MIQTAKRLIATLTDNHSRFHNYLRISITERCNLRCVYCMPEEGIKLSEKLMKKEEISFLANLFIKEGVDKIRLTGGEPTIRKDLFDILSSLNQHNVSGELKTIGLTTNGITLNRILPKLVENGVNALNISLDTLNPLKFPLITKRNGFDFVLKGLTAANECSFNNKLLVKLNCVVIRGVNDDEVLDFVEFVKDKNICVRFIEYMPFDGNKWNFDKFVPFAEIKGKIEEKYGKLERLNNYGKVGETSKDYGINGFKGRVGFITSMSNHFCSSCNRLRLTADGHLKVCLFGESEVDLLKYLRVNEGTKDCDLQKQELLNVISMAVKRKKAQHNGMFEISRSKNRSMIRIGEMFFTKILRNEIEKSFTHLTKDGKLSIVDISQKLKTKRKAIAQGRVFLSKETINQIKLLGNKTKKGDLFSVASIAGIMAAKNTSNLIPLCHQISLSHISCDFDLHEDSITITASCSCNEATGVEMEALTAVSVSALTIYDMCKAIDKNIVISDVKLVSKSK